MNLSAQTQIYGLLFLDFKVCLISQNLHFYNCYREPTNLFHNENWKRSYWEIYAAERLQVFVHIRFKTIRSIMPPSTRHGIMWQDQSWYKYFQVGINGKDYNWRVHIHVSCTLTAQLTSQTLGMWSSYVTPGMKGLEVVTGCCRQLNWFRLGKIKACCA